MSLRDRIDLLEDQVEAIFGALAVALTMEEPERTRLLNLVTRALRTAREDLRAVRAEDRRRPKLGTVAPIGAGAGLGALLTRLRNHKAVAVAATGAAALAIGITQLPGDGSPDGGQARPPAASPAPSPSATHHDPVPDGSTSGEKRPTSTRIIPAPSPPEARTDPRTLTTSGTRLGETPAEPGRPGPAIPDDVTRPGKTSDPAEPTPTDPPTTPPPDTSSPPDPTDPSRPDPGRLLCLEVELAWLVVLDLCVL